MATARFHSRYRLIVLWTSLKARKTAVAVAAQENTSTHAAMTRDDVRYQETIGATTANAATALDHDHPVP